MNLGVAAFYLAGAKHAKSVGAPDRIAGWCEDDNTAFATLKTGQLSVDHVVGGLLWRLALLDESADLARQGKADEIFADAGARHGA